MPLVHINGTGQFSIHMQVAGSQGESVITMGFQTANNDVAQIAHKALAAWDLTLMRETSSRCLLVSCTALLHVSDETESGLAVAAANTHGDRAPSMLPANCACLIRKTTDFAGRKNRGRIYIPGLPSDSTALDADTNTLTEAKRIAWQTAADNFFIALTASEDGDPLQPVILHPSPSTTVTEVRTFSVQARLATQRGRLRD
jgi:hypothetical protein